MGSQEGRQKSPIRHPGSVREWGEVLAVEEIDQVCYSWARTNREVTAEIRFQRVRVEARQCALYQAS